MSGHLRIYVELRGYGARGPRYQVRMNRPDGMVIINATTEPLFAAARILLSQGVTGKLQLWDGSRPYCRLQGDIERLAGMTVSDGDAGICLRKYVERTAGDDFDQAVTVSEHCDERPVTIALSDSDACQRTYTTKHGTVATTSARSAVAA